MKHIMIIDDSSLFLKVSAKVLRAEGYSVTAVTNPKLFRAARDPKPDLILVDLCQPEFLQESVVQYIRDEWRIDAPIYLCSSYSEDVLKRRSQEHGADGYVCKDWGLEGLVSSVERFLDARPIWRPSGAEQQDKMKHIVIIDDSEMVLKASSRALELAGFAVTTMTDPGDFEPGQDIKTDLLLVDINMPQFYGHDVVEYFKTEWSIEFPVYMFSDIAEEELERRTEDCGADGYICKSWGLESLISCVQLILGNPQSARQTST